ncbi:MAG: hypothetical protein K6G09_07335 [Treponema sp.]|nr:hypothetical protein [Treponema sp.]
MKATKLSAIITLLVSTVLLFSCHSKNGQPYATQKDNLWSRNACGAFSMAYYLAETGQIPGKKVESTAKKLYANIKFDISAGFGEYSDPFKIMSEITPYASKVSFGMNISNPKEPGEKLMTLLASRADKSQFRDIKDISSALAKNEYVIEIVVPRATVNLNAIMQNPLHYVLTYWKGDTLYTLDPGRGKEEPRQNFIDGTSAKWSFCNSGIFIIPN